MTVAKQIQRLKMQKSAELRAREHRAAKRTAGRLEKTLQNNRAPGHMFDPGFLSQLDRKARQARDLAGEQQRPDAAEAIEAARQKGHLPPAHDGSTEYVPTAEEILGDEALPKPPAPPGDDVEDLPSADDILNGVVETTGTPVPGSAFTQEELEEIARLNPGPKKGPAPAGKKGGKRQP
jgi:hypothetical protein